MSAIDIRRAQAHRLRRIADDCLPDNKEQALMLLREAQAIDEETELLLVKLGRRRRPSVIE